MLGAVEVFSTSYGRGGSNRCMAVAELFLVDGIRLCTGVLICRPIDETEVAGTDFLIYYDFVERGTFGALSFT